MFLCSVRADCSPSLATTHGIFPKVTNNLNTCHQPRLTPQYMDLRDLKFRICESGNIQVHFMWIIFLRIFHNSRNENFNIFVFRR